jgi:hypothetical protein
VKKRKRGAMALEPVGKFVRVAVLVSQEGPPPVGGDVAPSHGTVDALGPDVTVALAPGDEVYFAPSVAVAFADVVLGFVFVHESNLAAKFVE